MMALPLVALHIALPMLPLPRVTYQIHCIANTASAQEPRSTYIAPWLCPFCFMALKHYRVHHLADRRRVDVFDSTCAAKGASCVCSGCSTLATEACMNAPNNQPHCFSYDNAATDSIKHDLHSAGLDTTNAAQMVFDRRQWKAFVSGLPTLKHKQGS